MREPDPQCEICGGTGVVVQDYHDPSDHYGHGQRELPCECTEDDYGEDDEPQGNEPVKPKKPDGGKGGGYEQPIPTPLQNLDLTRNHATV